MFDNSNSSTSSNIYDFVIAFLHAITWAKTVAHLPTPAPALLPSTAPTPHRQWR